MPEADGPTQGQSMKRTESRIGDGYIPNAKKPRSRPPSSLRDKLTFVHAALPKYSGPYSVSRGQTCLVYLLLMRLGWDNGHRSSGATSSNILAHYSKGPTPLPAGDRPHDCVLPRRIRHRCWKSARWLEQMVSRNVVAAAQDRHG